MITTTISSKNQITLPSYLLKLLQLKNGDKLTVRLENKELRIKPVGQSLVDSLAGSLTVVANKKGINFDQVLLKTKKLVASKLAK
jgi:AbrB family looped-hinge helix DNA binding protein